MFERLSELRKEAQELASWLRPELLRGEEAASLLQEVAAIENTFAAMRVLLAGRVAQTKAWRRQGDRTAAHWVARATKTTVGHAVATLETARRLEKLPGTAEVFREGKVSETQAKEIAAAASVSPSSEDELLETARGSDLFALKDRCRRVRSAAVTDEVARYEAIRRSRYLRSWSDHDGAFRLDGRLTPDAGATVMAALEPHRQRAFEEARRAGVKEPQEAYLADALVGLAEEEPGEKKGRSRPRVMVQVRVDHAALVRGHAQGEERCEISGVGRIPVATARALLSDAIVSAVLTEGADIRAVAHVGRSMPARLRTAVEARDEECAVPGCHNRYHLEIDHMKPVTNDGPTSLENLVRLCRPHHKMKTYGGYRLEGRPGKWKWVSPEEPATQAERGPP